MFNLKVPRPDICIGLSDDTLAKDLEPGRGRSAARRFLFDLQDTSVLISDPHVTPMGLRFPFLIVEAKAGATGGNLYQAQNQTAVGGSAALQILWNLWELQYAQSLERESLPGVMFQLAFSVTTEGPIHELWLHFRKLDEEEFYMSCIGTWRTTIKEHSQHLVCYLCAILRWGNGDFRNGIISALRGL